MSERRTAVSGALTIGTVALAPPFISLGLVLLVIWALTADGGYFWPMWPYSAMLLIIGLRLVFVSDRSGPRRSGDGSTRRSATPASGRCS